MRPASWRKRSGVGPRVAQFEQDVVHERMVDRGEPRRRELIRRVRISPMPVNSPSIGALRACCRCCVVLARRARSRRSLAQAPRAGRSRHRQRHRRHDGRRRGACFDPGSVAISGTTIVGVGAAERDRRDSSQARDAIDARGRVVMPGLINTHTHAPMVLYRGLADDLALMDWLQKYIFPAEAKTVSPAFVRTGTRLAALEMIRSGTTTYVDMYYFEEEIARATQGGRAARRARPDGHRVSGAPTPRRRPRRWPAPRRSSSEFQNDDLITPAVAPHCGLHARCGHADAVARSGDRSTTCRSSSTSPRPRTRSQLSLERHKARPVAAARQRSASGRPRRHCRARRLDSARGDRACSQQHGVGVSHNPESNMKLASGTAPVLDYLKAGVALGLGTDGAASNNDLDMFEAMRQAAFLHKLTSQDPRAVSARTALEMATHRRRPRPRPEKRLGSLEAGKLADRHRRADGPSRARRRCTTRSRTSSTSRAATTWRRRSSTAGSLMRGGQGADARREPQVLGGGAQAAAEQVRAAPCE